MIDPDRVGMVGHSWGAYQTAFMMTQTDIFAAGIAGAPLTDLISMYLSIYWNSGSTDARIFEISQGRMEVPPWEDLEVYMNNSALFNIESMNTPLLVAFGDEDGAVDWHQGIELYNAARRAGKDFVMLVYPGENHSLRQKPNQIDYHLRILQWFGHYLKGDEAEPWISDGVTLLDREKEVERAQEERGGGGNGRRGRGGGL
jgi:dipeptidyl aminopeptidase/acylaminoacyl peptidase